MNNCGTPGRQGAATPALRRTNTPNRVAVVLIVVVLRVQIAIRIEVHVVGVVTIVRRRRPQVAVVARVVQ